MLQGLKYIPKCWAVVQPFLCSLFMPKCVNDTVYLPTQEMCKIVLGACRILVNHTIWPNFIHCNNTELFPSSCNNIIREVKFDNTNGKCHPPLVPTNYSLAVFEGIDGCGLPCRDPLYTHEEQKQIHTLITWAAYTCLMFNMFTIVSTNLHYDTKISVDFVLIY